MENKLTLLVCSNRKGVAFPDIWKQVIDDKRLDKIILVTQGNANSYLNRQSKVMHVRLTNTGRGKAINRGLQEVHTEFVGLTDDDCYLHKDWISHAINVLSDPSVSMVYGQTFAYQAKHNKGKVCPCTFTKKSNTYTVVSNIRRHWTDIGFDNNAAIKRSVFEEIGGYKWWLGPGSIGKNAEDAEFILRALITKHHIAYNPAMIVYHNKWLTKQAWKHALRIYLCGGVAAYGFYAMQGIKECQLVVKSYILGTLHDTISDIKGLHRKPETFTRMIKDTFANFYYLCWGLMIAFLFARVIPIPKKENVIRLVDNEQ